MSLELRQKMKPALASTALFCALVLPMFPVTAQEHVDVPLPPYDPPPTVSHHNDTHNVQAKGVSRDSLAPAKGPKEPHPGPKERHVKGSPQNQQHHRRHVRRRRQTHFHWPWQRRKLSR